MADYNSIISQLEQRQYKPVYLLYGDEPFFIDKITDFIAENVLSDTEKSFNQTIFYGKDTDIRSVIETAKRYPMMADKQVVIVREAQDLKKIEELDQYMTQPVESTILVLAMKYKKPDGRKKVFKEMKKQGVSFESKPVYENQMQKWISEYVHFSNRKISPKATVLILEYIGNNLSLISNELGKIFISIPEGAEITDQNVSDIIGLNKDYNTFELQNAVGKRDFNKAMQIAIYFGSHQKEHPFTMSLYILNKFFTNILLMYFSPNAGKNDMAKLLGVNPYFLEDYYTAKRNFPAGSAVKAIELLRKYDLKSKGVNSSSIPSGELLKELIYKILKN